MAKHAHTARKLTALTGRIRRNGSNHAAGEADPADPDGEPGSLESSSADAACPPPQDVEAPEDSPAPQDDGPLAGEDTVASRSRPDVRLATAGGLVIMITLSALSGWIGYRAHIAHQADAQRNVFVQVARQAAVNLSTISYTEADDDVQRILDSSTGEFHDDFQKRSKPFIDTLNQAQAKSEGTVTEAGLESEGGGHAQVLVGVAVKSSSAGVQDPQPRLWRMRITVTKVGNDAKVSNVGFVP